MKNDKSVIEAAKRSGNPAYDLTPLLPGNDNIGPLKDMAQEITAASAGLEGKVASDTATALGDQLRLINSYYSNLIEGHKTTIPDIEMALRKEFNRDPEKNMLRNCVPLMLKPKSSLCNLSGSNTVYGKPAAA